MYINKNHVKREEAAAEKNQGYQLLKLLNQHGSNFSDCLYCDARMDTYRAIRSSENFSWPLMVHIPEQWNRS